MSKKQLFAPVDAVIEDLSNPNIHEYLRLHYGRNDFLIERRREQIQNVVEAHRRAHSENERIAVVRVPGRINLMGVHIDHRGGWCNYLPIGRETLFCVSPRDDDRIVAKNVSAEYADLEFSMNSELPVSKRGRWMDFIESLDLERGFWGNYLRAGALKLRDHLPDFPLKGANFTIDGDIPPRSGLSSSSTLVVGTILALSAVNEISIPDFELVEMCGEGEWYVGTRGGCGDHAAIILGRLNEIVHTGFKPLSVSYSEMPDGYDVVLAQSGIQANKSAGARETFNSRIAAYEAALVVYQEAHPHLRDKVQYLRDISPDTLGIGLDAFYSTVKSIPVSMSKDELLQAHPQQRETWLQIFSTFGEPSEPLPLREALLFGVTECERAKRFSALLESDIALAGQYMYTSHDGDRVVCWENETSRPYRSPFDNTYLDSLSSGSRNDSDLETHQLAWQPGGYRCSVPELDRIVDRCKTLPGIVGAGLTGAGLGGSVLALVRSGYTDDVIQKLKDLISIWRESEPWVEKCIPVAGASLL